MMHKEFKTFIKDVWEDNVEWRDHIHTIHEPFHKWNKDLFW